MTTTQRAAMRQALERLRMYHYNNGFAADAEVISDLRAALAEQLTDEDISVLWHQSGEQPFKFARMLMK